jgi:hypothetical protein
MIISFAFHDSRKWVSKNKMIFKNELIHSPTKKSKILQYELNTSWENKIFKKYSKIVCKS